MIRPPLNSDAEAASVGRVILVQNGELCLAGFLCENWKGYIERVPW